MQIFKVEIIKPDSFQAQIATLISIIVIAAIAASHMTNMHKVIYGIFGAAMPWVYAFGIDPKLGFRHTMVFFAVGMSVLFGTGFAVSAIMK